MSAGKESEGASSPAPYWRAQRWVDEIL